jgi:hypothetical protein
MEMAIFPADYLLRRTRLGLFRPTLMENLPRGLPPPPGPTQNGQVLALAQEAIPEVS